MHRFKKKQYTNPTLVRSIAHCSRARVFNKRYQRHFCGQLADVNRHNVTNYLTDEKEKRERERERERKEKKRKERKKERKKERGEKKDEKRTKAAERAPLPPLFPVVIVAHRYVVYLCREATSMFTCAQLDRARPARIDVCPLYF